MKQNLYALLLLCFLAAGVNAQNQTLNWVRMDVPDNNNGSDNPEQDTDGDGGNGLTSQEQGICNQLLNWGTHDAAWLVDMTPIPDLLTREAIKLRFPNVEGTFNFKLHNMKKNGDDSYWEGYDNAGNSATFWTTANGTEGEFYFVSSNTQYGLYLLSATNSVLKKYNNGIAGLQGAPCTDDGHHDDFEVPDDETTEREPCEGNMVRVLFLYTSSAFATGTNFATLSTFIINQLNSSLSASGISSTQLNYVTANVLPLTTFVETNLSLANFTQLKNSSEAKTLRDNNYADLVVLLCAGQFVYAQGDADNYGNSENAYCLSTILNARTQFKATHGIGHIMGARHQRYNINCGLGQEPSVHPFDYAHGYQMGSTFRTIMSDCFNNPVRVGNWSSNTILFNSGGVSFPTGNNNNDNARRLVARAADVSCFRGAPPGNPPYSPLTIEIRGDENICNGQDEIYNINFTTVGIPPPQPITYKWERYDGATSSWVEIGTSPAISIYGATIGGISIRVIVTDGLGSTAMAFKTVFVIPCFVGEGTGNRNQQVAYGSNQPDIMISPNPAHDYLQVEGLKAEMEVLVQNTTGQVILHSVQSGDFSIDLSAVPPGIYFVTLKNEQQSITQKIQKM